MTNATAHHWWEHNIGSGHGLVPSGTKPLPGLMLTPICIAIRHHLATTSQWRCCFFTALNWNIYVCFSIYAFFTHCGKYTYSTGTHHYRPLRAHSRIPNMYSLYSFGIWEWFDILKVNITLTVLKLYYKYSLLMHCIKIKAPRNFYWMSNMFLWVEIFIFFVCYHVVPKRHCQLDHELNGL